MDLDLKVLNYNDLGLLSPGGALFMVHQIAKEVMAMTNVANSAGALVEGLKL